MTYDSSERSVQDGQPTEIYTFVAPVATYRFTSGPEDVTVSGQLYVSIPIGRGNTTSVPLGQVRETIVSIPVEHPFTTVLIGGGIPPRDILLTIERFHPGSAIRQLWKGYVSDVATDGVFARLRVPNATDDAFAVRLPLLVAQRVCNHVLYDRGCGVNRTYQTYANQEHMSIATVLSASGASLVVSALDNAIGQYRGDQWAQHGEVRRVTDGERRSILDQTGTTLTLDVPFGTLTAGDDLEIYAGCDHLVETCRDKFDNVLNFGAHPDLPNNNVHAPSGYGVIVQS